MEVFFLPCPEQMIFYNDVVLSGIEPESWVPETHIISIILQDRK